MHRQLELIPGFLRFGRQADCLVDIFDCQTVLFFLGINRSLQFEGLNLDFAGLVQPSIHPTQCFGVTFAHVVKLGNLKHRVEMGLVGKNIHFDDLFIQFQSWLELICGHLRLGQTKHGLRSFIRVPDLLDQPAKLDNRFLVLLFGDQFPGLLYGFEICFVAPHSLRRLTSRIILGLGQHCIACGSSNDQGKMISTCFIMLTC